MLEERSSERETWSEEKIIQEIQDLHKGGNDLASRTIWFRKPKLWIAAKGYFGNWKNAITEAGLDYQKIRKVKAWSAEQIIQEIQNLTKSGEKVNSGAIKKEHPDLYIAGRRKFGSWEKAVVAAGIKYESVRKVNKWSKDKVIGEIQKLQKENKNLNIGNAKRSYRQLLHAALYYFDTWEKALNEAGINYEQVRKNKRWSKIAIIEEIKKLPSGDYLEGKNVTYPLFVAAERYFGSWQKAIEAANSGAKSEEFCRTVGPPRKWTKRKIIAEIIKKHENREDISDMEMSCKFPALRNAAVRLFGNWREAVKASRIDYATVRKDKKWSEEKVKIEIRKLYAKNPDMTTIRMMKEFSSLYSAGKYYFITWKKAVETSMDGYVLTVLRCPECGGVPVRDFFHAERYCGSCGLVLDSDIIDRRAEWRSFNREEELKRARAEKEFTGKLGSVIIGNKDSEGKLISGKLSQSVGRIVKWDGKRGTYQYVLSDIVRYSTMFGFSEDAQRKAKDLFKRNFTTFQPWLIRDRFVGPLIYAISKEIDIPETIRERIKEKFNIIPLEGKIVSMCLNLKVGEEVESKSLELLEQAREKWEFIRETESFGEAIVYIASQSCKNKVTQMKAASIADIPYHMMNTEIHILAEHLGIDEELRKVLKKHQYQGMKNKGIRTKERILKIFNENAEITLEELAAKSKVAKITAWAILHKEGLKTIDLKREDYEKELDKLYAGIDISKLSREERRKLIQETVRDHRNISLDAIGKRFGISRERVRQIASLIGVNRSKQP